MKFSLIAALTSAALAAPEPKDKRYYYWIDASFNSSAPTLASPETPPYTYANPTTLNTNITASSSGVATDTRFKAQSKNGAAVLASGSLLSLVVLSLL
ncbi:uncharacterized protein LODBEIA_P53100 [Lodderomyces beijingensis]|uniref:Uncharacterized protein n=1 Tax=Lodderomyces beijingensis TaxID=1775926 RepID=A0ABP0ZVE4_9ASCO